VRVDLLKCDLLETLSRLALIQQMNIMRRESRSAEIEEEKIEKRHLNMFFDSRAEFAYERVGSLVELKIWVNHNTQRMSLPEKFKKAVNSNKDKQKKFIKYLQNQVIKRKKNEQDEEKQKPKKKTASMKVYTKAKAKSRPEKKKKVEEVVDEVDLSEDEDDFDEDMLEDSDGEASFVPPPALT